MDNQGAWAAGLSRGLESMARMLHEAALREESLSISAETLQRLLSAQTHITLATMRMDVCAWPAEPPAAAPADPGPPLPLPPPTSAERAPKPPPRRWGLQVTTVDAAMLQEDPDPERRFIVVDADVNIRGLAWAAWDGPDAPHSDAETLMSTCTRMSARRIVALSDTRHKLAVLSRRKQVVFRCSYANCNDRLIRFYRRGFRDRSAITKVSECRHAWFICNACSSQRKERFAITVRKNKSSPVTDEDLEHMCTHERTRRSQMARTGLLALP